MSTDLNSFAEKCALKAIEIPAFSGVNLPHIKKQVASLLALIGRETIFDEYTKHDISHINEMLRSLEWIIPASTKEIMSNADWLMIVLSIYFHDMGMLVTKAEFRERENSGFRQFCEAVLFSGAGGLDYKAKIEELPIEERDKFLYQEFVRSKHAERIRSWISGTPSISLGAAQDVWAETNKLLDGLGHQFRRDLGIVCESHHLNDLADLNKYKVSNPYDNSDSATVNMQYCAVLLRTADLLHITSNRTPAIEFRTINPTDPISQSEWAKQMAVTRVKPKAPTNEEGVVDEHMQSDTIEVHAYFEKENGFFGLTSYLSYAVDQLKKSHEWISSTAKMRKAKHEFPWRRIDDTNIETAGFIRHAFEFTIDQAKILDLLTGHTLYNDTNVVLRELVQNAIDAIRVKYYPEDPKEVGVIEIDWNSFTRVLSVKDNGTGMTQEIINNYLLKVGSSRYQDPEFKKANPGFSAISRFGIGVLSTFMIADSVEVITCHTDEEKARRLLLRSVHGKYLMHLIDKNSEEAKILTPHGTIFKLHVRPTVQIGSILDIAKQWIVIPECKVFLKINGGSAIRIGYDSPADALRAFLSDIDVEYVEDPGLSEKEDIKHIKIVERNCGGVTIAYALLWDRWFKEWSFLSLGSVWRQEYDEYGNYLYDPLLGTCVEGIRIVNDTPGFDGHTIVALANVRGINSPKTNVARSGLEITPEREEMLKIIYTLYSNHIITEIDELSSDRSFSLTWATSETSFLLRPLIVGDGREARALNQKLFDEALLSIPCILVEEEGKRTAKSPNEIQNIAELWSIDCGILSSAESVIREVAGTSSLTKLVTALDVPNFELPKQPLICGSISREPLVEKAFSGKEVDKIIVNQNHRRVDLRWVDKASPSRWADIPEKCNRMFRHYHERGNYRSSIHLPNIPRYGIDVKVPGNEVAVRAFGEYYLLPDSAIALHAQKMVEKTKENNSNDNLFNLFITINTIYEYLDAGHGPTDKELLRKSIHKMQALSDVLANVQAVPKFNIDELWTIVNSTNWKLFDTWAWRRGGAYYEE